MNELFPDEVLILFPIQGGNWWALKQSKLDEYEATYPDAPDAWIYQEMLRALQWLNDNPTKRKTAGGMPRYLGNWISSAMQKFRQGGGAKQRREQHGVDPEAYKGFMEGG